MYGGLQASIGFFALAALVRPRLARPLLLAIAFLVSGLALGRLGGIVTDGGVTAYTGGAVALELVLVASSLYFLSRQQLND